MTVRATAAVAGVVMAALLSWSAGPPGALAKEKDQWSERLTFSTGRSASLM